jgi:PIN domain nuclease of toxin-antitoxin system
MRLLLDTCAFAWACSEPARFSDQVRQAIADPANEVFLSAISVWELSIKMALREFIVSESPRLSISLMRDQLAITPLPFDELAAEYVAQLPALHRDPFDRALIASAVVHEMAIVTPDSLIKQYAVKVVW